MKDFIEKAKSAVGGPKNTKSQPDRPDESRAKDVSTSRRSDAGAVKAQLKKNRSRFKGPQNSKSGGFGGSSAGLINQSSARLRIDNGEVNLKNSFKVLESGGSTANMVGGRGRNITSQVVDYTRRGNSGSINSIASLEKRTKLNRMFK